MAKGRPKPGPSLTGIAGKTTAAWTYRWLESPRGFSATAWMLDLFPDGLDGEESNDRRTAELRAIVVYLWDRSRPLEHTLSPAGDAEAGRMLFRTVGCAGCHLVDPAADRGSFYPDFARLHGPDLARIGSKVDAAWLDGWLRSPHAYRSDTPMPDFRLDLKEAADLTAYLMSRRDPESENLEMPPMPAEARDELVLEHLRQTHTVEQSSARLEAMSERQRDFYLGERTIARYGCHGCHQIPGFGDVATLDGGDLRSLGSRLDLVLGEASGIVFHRSRLSPPAADPPLSQPDYGLQTREAQTVLTALLGLRERGRYPSPSPRAAPLAAGRELIHRYGCRGCHRSAGSGPDLFMEGARVRSSWLFSFLRDPGANPVRPWLDARMPTFHLRDADLDVLVRYFADRDGSALFTSEPPAPSRQSLVVGRAVYGMLQCGRCHVDVVETGGLQVSTPSPVYALARERLRPRWVVDWILDPRRWHGAAMPVSFPPDEDGRPDSSFLAGNVTTPMFRLERDRLLRVFETEDEMGAFLDDPGRVASALRDHLWSLSR